MTTSTAAAAAGAAADAAPAGGAALAEVLIATAIGGGSTVLLVLLGLAHRAGRTQLLQRAADGASRVLGLPPWAALPTQLASLSLLCALFGMMWDIAIHIDAGRDEGPLANPGHWFILAGLFGVFAAGFLAVVLPKGKVSGSAVRIAGDWYAPVGGLVLLGCAAFSLTGFPLDDLWHRLFGQDVTLWGPTHLMLIGGAGLALIGQAILLVEGKRAAAAQGVDADASPAIGGLAGRAAAFLHRTRYAAVCGGLLIGLSTFQAEFDFGVPQFRLLFHPILIAFAAGVALTAARLYAGPRGAYVAVGYWLVIRGTIALLVLGLGETLPLMPLYVAEAIIVERVAAAVGTDRPYRFGALAGLGIGTVGFAAEWAYAQVGFRVEWPTSLLLDGAIVVPLTGVAAGLAGAYLGAVLDAVGHDRDVPVPSLAPAAAGVAAIAAVVGFGLQTKPVEGVTAAVTLTEASAGPERTVNATVRIRPASAARDADFLNATAWQGQGFQVDALRKVGEGVYETVKPLPAHGTWKSLIRLHDGRSLVAMPVFMPRDSAIPAPEVPALASFERPFVQDKLLLQREQKDGVAGGLWAVAYGVVGLITLTLLVVLGWALRRLGAGVSPDGGTRPRRRAAGRREAVAA